MLFFTSIQQLAGAEMMWNSFCFYNGLLKFFSEFFPLCLVLATCHPVRLGFFRRFSGRFSQKSRRFFSLNGHNTSIIKYWTMKNVDINCWTYPTFFLNKMFYVIFLSSATIQILYTYYYYYYYAMAERMSQVIIQF